MGLRSITVSLEAGQLREVRDLEYGAGYQDGRWSLATDEDSLRRSRDYRRGYEDGKSAAADARKHDGYIPHASTYIPT